MLEETLKNTPLKETKYVHQKDEWANTITHGIGFLLSAVGLVFLLQTPLGEGNYWKLFAFTVYGLSLITLYLTSTLYHNSRNPRLKQIFRLLDHCAIYLLIAGSYTPFTLISLEGIWGWTLFGMIWSLAFTGILFKIFFIHRFEYLSTAIYLIMGWLIVIAIEPLVNSLSTEGLYWIVAGGLSYTTGVIFFLLDRKPFFHAIWHLFVMCGSTCHYFAISLHV
jgi:hemolysin III